MRASVVGYCLLLLFGLMSFSLRVEAHPHTYQEASSYEQILFAQARASHGQTKHFRRFLTRQEFNRRGSWGLLSPTAFEREFRFRRRNLRGWWVRKFDNGRRAFSGRYRRGRAQGWHTFYFPNGRKRLEARFRDGELDGWLTAWFDNGRRRASMRYRRGELDGWVEEFFRNGRRALSVRYRRGKREGWASCYFSNGRLKARGRFRDGRPAGWFELWTPKGQRRWTARLGAEKSQE